MSGRLLGERCSWQWSAVLALTFLCWCLKGSAFGEGVRDFSDGWLLNPDDTVAILAGDDLRGTMKFERGWGLWAAAGQGVLFSVDDLPQKSLEGGLVKRGGRWPWSVACSWDRLGDYLMVEETGHFRLRLGRNPQVGIRVRARRWLVENQKIDAGMETALQGRLLFRMFGELKGDLALWMHPTESVRWHHRRGRRTLANLKIFYPGSGLAVRLEQRGDGTPVLSLEYMVRLATGLGVGFRVDPETGSLGGSLVARVGGPWLRTSHLVHPALGVTHRFQLGVGDPGACVW